MYGCVADTMTENVKKYNKMEKVLQEISKNHISLPQKEIERNNKILEQVLLPIRLLLFFKAHLYFRAFLLHMRQFSTVCTSRYKDPDYSKIYSFMIILFVKVVW